MEALNRADPDEAERLLRDLCGSTSWARDVAGARPFPDATQLHDTSAAAFDRLIAEDWDEAFAAHPRIGERGDAGHQSVLGAEWSDAEQAASRQPDDAVRAQIAALSREYEKRFDRVFLVRAAGRTAGEILSLLRDRLENDPDTERQIAEGEQRQITRLRIDRMLAP